MGSLLEVLEWIRQDPWRHGLYFYGGPALMVATVLLALVTVKWRTTFYLGFIGVVVLFAGHKLGWDTMQEVGNWAYLFWPLPYAVFLFVPLGLLMYTAPEPKKDSQPTSERKYLRCGGGCFEEGGETFFDEECEVHGDY